MIRRPDTSLPHAYEAMGDSKVVCKFPLSHTPFKPPGPDVLSKLFVGLQQVEWLKLCEPGRKSLSVDEVWTASPLLPVANHIGTSTYVIGQVRPAHSQRGPALHHSLAETYNKNGF